jgi:hypothetical protein
MRFQVMYVVYGLSHPVLLSNDFTENHREVWTLAKSVAVASYQLNLSWFEKEKLTKEQQKAEEELRAKQLQENRDGAKAEKEKRVAATKQSLGYGSSTSSPGPGPGSATSGSTSSSTSLSLYRWSILPRSQRILAII